MKSQEKMIEELRDIGIEVYPVMKAFVGEDTHIFPCRDNTAKYEMGIEDAHRKYCCSIMRRYDPFTGFPIFQIPKTQ